MDTLKIRVIIEYEFRRGTNATQTARNIKNVYGENCTNERTTRYWFSRFRFGNFDLKNEARGRPETSVNNNELKAIVEADETQSTAELAAAFDGTTMRESLRRLASEEGVARKVGSSRRVRVELLDGDHITVDLDRKSRGEDLLDAVCDSLDVVERDYFGLLYTQRGDSRVWVDLDRRLSKAFRNEPWDVRFAVKFYPPEPGELRDEHARSQLGLAVRRDLIEGRLTCSAITYALLASYILQAELGDHEDSHMSPSLLSKHRAAPLSALTPDLEAKLEELYKKHKGQTPAEAELNYLENAKRLALYGAELHPAHDSDDVDICLAVCASGVSVYRDGLIMNRFPWAKITKICYNKRAFTLTLRASEFEEFETHLTFKLPSTRACKKLWKCSVEHHMFFRRSAPVRVERFSGFPRLGARRLSCRRTLRQLRDPAP